MMSPPVFVAAADLPTWGSNQSIIHAPLNTNESDSAESAIRDGEGSDASRFPVDDAVNARLCLWEGAVERVKCDALIHPTSESLLENDAVIEAGGDGLRRECVEVNRKLRRNKLTKFLSHVKHPSYFGNSSPFLERSVSVGRVRSV